MKKRFWISIGLSLLAPSLTWAHDTVVVHPRITEEAIRVIESEDSRKAYAELYQEKDGATDEYSYKRFNWGNNPELNEVDALTDRSIDRFSKVHLNVLDGVVMEDDPVTIVLRHFYHAYAGTPMSLDAIGSLSIAAEHVTSKVAGVRFFDQAIEVFGYDSEEFEDDQETYELGFKKSFYRSNELGYWLFGHSLHHLEDMNSIAHVSGDGHITLHYVDKSVSPDWFQERDDYEANYLPSKVWAQDPEVISLFKNTTAYPVDHFDDIWPAPVPAGSTSIDLTGNNLKVESLARSVFNHSVFQGSFEYPIVFAPSNPCGSGELALMFNDPSLPSCRVHWNAAGHLDFPEWRIDGVGDYEYQVFIGPDSQWWESDEFDGPTGYFYLEQLMDGIGRGTCAGQPAGECVPFADSNLVVPYKIRGKFGEVYSPANNPLVANTTPLALWIARSVVPLGPSYAAGYARWWYQIANTPPYVKKVEVKQAGKNVYEGEWKDILGKRKVSLINELHHFNLPIYMQYVRARELDAKLNIDDGPYLTANEDLEITLEFNEPIRLPIDPDSGFALGLGTRMFAADSFKKIENLSENTTPLKVNIRWRFTIAAADLADLNGKIPLVVRARDVNEHWNNIGAELDEDPATPARRKRRESAAERVDFSETGAANAGWLDYTWHDKESIDVSYVNQALTSDDKMMPGDFSYDASGEGDQNHILIFDNEMPASVNLDGRVQDPPDA